MKTIDEISDIVELQTWAEGKPITQSTLIARLENALDVDERKNAGKIAQNVLDEFQNRQKMLGAAYPFISDGAKLEVTHAAPATTTYLFCLGLSLLPKDQIENENRAVQFETVVTDAAKKIFGGKGLRIGAPWKNAAIPDYGTLLDKVVELIPNLGKKMRDAAPGGGDAGWDVLVVKNFCDGDIPRFVALGNCATGRTDWKRKGMEVQPTLFWSYFQSDHRSVFITFFAVPFTMDEEARLRKLSSSALTLDRLRICEHAPTTSMDETRQWLESQRLQALNVPLI